MPVGSLRMRDHDGVRRHGEDDLPLEPLEPPGMPSRPGMPSAPRRRGWPLVVVPVAVAVVVLAMSLAARGRQPRAGPASTTTAPVQATGLVPSSSMAMGPTVEVIDVGRPVMDVPANWELFGRSDDEVVRIQLAAGRVTRTRVPALTSSGPVSFIVGPDRVIIRPLDRVPGYAVLDGQPPQRLTRPFGSGPVLPGPDSGHVWVSDDTSDPRRMVLVGVDGTPTTTSVPTPDTVALSDGRGWLLVADGSGGSVYRVGPEGRTLVTTGGLVAVGPTRWVAAECDAPSGCSTVVIDRTTGSRRVIGPSDADPSRPFPFPSGIVSPDGTVAAVMREDTTGRELHLLDLGSGVDHTAGLRGSQAAPVAADQAMVWSPDSRWLFMADVTGTVFVVDPRTNGSRALSAPLPPITQLAFRAAA